MRLKLMLTNEDATDKSTELWGGRLLWEQRRREHCEELRGQLGMEREYSPREHTVTLGFKETEILMQESCALKHKGLSRQQSFLASPIPGSPLQSITVISYTGCIALPLPVQHAIKTTTANRLAITEAKPPSLVHLWRGSLKNTDFTNHWCCQFN